MEYATILDADEACKLNGMMVADRALRVQNGIEYQRTQAAMAPPPGSPTLLPGGPPSMMSVQAAALAQAQQLQAIQSQMEAARQMADQVLGLTGWARWLREELCAFRCICISIPHTCIHTLPAARKASLDPTLATLWSKLSAARRVRARPLCQVDQGGPATSN